VDAVHLDAQCLGLLLDEHVRELARGAPALELGDDAPVERQPRSLPRAFLLQPVRVRAQNGVDLPV